MVVRRFTVHGGDAGRAVIRVDKIGSRGSDGQHSGRHNLGLLFLVLRTYTATML